jgi:hypothetical protein
VPLKSKLKKLIKNWLSNGILIKIQTINKRHFKNLDKFLKLMKFYLIKIKKAHMIHMDLMLLILEIVEALADQVLISPMPTIYLSTFFKTTLLIMMMMLISSDLFSARKEVKMEMVLVLDLDLRCLIMMMGL